MMSAFEFDYFIFVTVASLGVLQIAASKGNYMGLLFSKSPIASRFLGTTTIVIAFVWFFGSNNRNINDYAGGMDGNDQALFFFIGSMAGLIITLIVSSLVNWRMVKNPTCSQCDLDSLKETNYFFALNHNFLYWCKKWRTQMSDYFSG